MVSLALPWYAQYLALTLHSNARVDAAKLRWDGVRCLFEDAQSDILLLLDACSVPESIPESSHGVKQVIAASSPSSSDTSSPASPAKPNPPGFFTRCLVDAFSRLCDRPFTTQRLHEELADLLHSNSHRHSPLSPSQKALPNQAPLFFSLTSANNKTLTLSPLSPPSTSQPDRDASSPSPLEGLIDRTAISKLRFDSARVLACTTFVGDASPGMSAFHQWLQDVPSHASGIALEAMFLGPPTMLLISMPTSVWNAVQHDKVCCFLGYVSSHNMLQLYETLVGPSSLSPSAAVEDGKSLVHAREAASGSPHRRGMDAQKANVRSADTPSSDHLSSPSGRLYQSIAANSLAIKPKDNPNQDSAEMQEAAEQLKALSHVRHRSDDSPPQSQNRTSLIDTIPDGTRRRSLPKQETSCKHCSHAPFRDSSSLRKHIAAHHTRPFPCAFSFAGCSSTFGSKNEWKRHMASQHLCLQYYRCSACPQTGANPASSSSATATDGKSNEFNRKDLFTQHLRRMHAPSQVKRATAATAKSDADVALHSEWDAQVKAMQKECLVTRRRPPQKAKCPKPGCEGRFDGAAAWDEWTEHVGRHMEKGEADDLEVDNLLTTWALVEGIIEPTGSADSDSFRLRAAPTPGSSQPVESQGTQESLTPWGKSFASSQMQSQSQSSQMRAPSPS